jgi:soluble lytic murein transglycosylase-like protein
MRRQPPLAATLLAIVVCAAILSAAPGARADYAVLKSGVRLHISGYEPAGNPVGSTVRLAIDGGTIEVPAAELIGIEPEDQFPGPPAAAMPEPGPFAQLIRDAAKKHGVDEKLIRHVILVESNYNPRAVSRRQAQGLMQLLPQTAAKYSVANVYDPAQNIDAGTHYLKDLLARFRGNLKLALAAYNAGPELVERYGGVPPYPETQGYVRKILALVAAEKN